MTYDRAQQLRAGDLVQTESGYWYEVSSACAWTGVVETFSLCGDHPGIGFQQPSRVGASFIVAVVKANQD
jgi:hypothetical protein